MKNDHTVAFRTTYLLAFRLYLTFFEFECSKQNNICIHFIWRFIITYARDERRPTDQDNCLCIFDVFTGEKRKSFSPAGRGVRIPEWPFIKWSFDEKYFAFCRPRGNSICIYDTDTFAPNGKPIELDGLLRFEFNPAKNLIAFYCEERVSKCR